MTTIIITVVSEEEVTTTHLTIEEKEMDAIKRERPGFSILEWAKAAIQIDLEAVQEPIVWEVPE